MGLDVAAGEGAREGAPVVGGAVGGLDVGPRLGWLVVGRAVVGGSVGALVGMSYMSPSATQKCSTHPTPPQEKRCASSSAKVIGVGANTGAALGSPGIGVGQGVGVGVGAGVGFGDGMAEGAGAGKALGIGSGAALGEGTGKALPSPPPSRTSYSAGGTCA